MDLDQGKHSLSAKCAQPILTYSLAFSQTIEQLRALLRVTGFCRVCAHGFAKLANHCKAPQRNSVMLFAFSGVGTQLLSLFPTTQGAAHLGPCFGIAYSGPIFPVCD